MTKDFLTLGASYSHQLFQIPPFEQFKKTLNTSSFMTNLMLFIEPAFPNITVEPSESFLDQYYDQLVQTRIKEFDQDSFLYIYLAVTYDFHIIKNAYLRFRSNGESQYFHALQKTEGLNLLAFDQYTELLEHAEAEFHAIEDTFEFVNHIDRLYLLTLCTAMPSKNEYIQRILHSQLELYNLMSVLRLTQLGRPRERILPLLIECDGVYSTRSILSIPFGDVISEVGKLVGLKPEEMSITAIETLLIERELKAVNQAMFYGAGQERILQYFEKIKFFIGDIKLALAAHHLDIPYEKVQKRLINYDLI